VQKIESKLAELQGLYGPFGFPERLLQKIWLRGEFLGSTARLADGRTLRVLSPGRWNQLGGPDFRLAHLEIGDRRITGDVELHLREADWRTHAHATDPAYDDVVLHVVLFPTDATTTAGHDGRRIPLLVLLPLLTRGLEDYAEDDVVERFANRAHSQALDVLGALPEVERRRVLKLQAERRWEQKTRYAALRVQRLGWEEACHQTALEVLGYRYNRGAMLRVAASWPLAAWRNTDGLVGAVYTSEMNRWSVQGVRPANHPKTRLEQYARWVEAVPDWPERLRAWDWLNPPGDDEATRGLRKEMAYPTLRKRFCEELVGGALGGSRLDTLVCDAWFPLAAVANKAVLGHWFHWYPGDLPPHLAQTLRQIGVISRCQPLCHGLAQGLLGWWMAQERVLGVELG